MVRSIKRKRSSNHQVSDDTLKKRKPKSKDLQDNFMSNVFTQSGFVFPESNLDQNELSVDQTIFQKKVLLAIKNDQSSVDKVVSGIEELWNDSLRFCFSILPTHSNADCINSSRGQQQESLVRLLLGIKPLQVKIGCLVLEKLAESSIDEDITSAALKVGDIDIVNIIVAQFKWLENLVGDMGLLDKLFEVLNICDNKIKEELIACIPDLCIDENHETVASKLRDLMLDNSDLVPCVLEALSNMNLKGQLFQDIRETVLKILSSAALKDLPSVVKFLQLSFDDDNGYETILQIRDKIDFSKSLYPGQPSSESNRKILAMKDEEAKIFDSLKTGIRFQKSVADVWTKVVEGIKSSESFEIIDLYICFVLFTVKSRQKNIESLIRSKIKNGVITSLTLGTSLDSHPGVFSEFMKEIQYLAGTLLRSTEHIFSKFGGEMYKKAFLNFDGDCQKMIMETLITHIGCGHTNEIESTLEVLECLVEISKNKLSPYLNYFKDVLKNSGKLSINNLRSVYKMIGQLSMTKDEERNQLINNIKAELSSNFLRNKKIGVVSGMMYFSSLSKYLEDNQENNKQIIDLLTLIMESINGQPELLCLFFDELSTITASDLIKENVLNLISEKIVTEFQNEFLVDIDAVKNDLIDEYEFAYDLDKQDDGGICVNILPLVVDSQENERNNASKKKNVKDKLLSLSSHFRFVQISESKLNNGNLDGIDALLGCPIVLHKNKSVEEFRSWGKDKQISFCFSLLYAANWIREILNGFSGINIEDTMQEKLITRTQQLNEIQNLLSKCLPVCSHLELPVVDQRIGDDLLSSIKSLKEIVEQTQFKKPKQRKRKNVQPHDQTNITNTTGNNTVNPTDIEQEDDMIEEDTNAIHEGSIDLSLFPASFRELELKVFHILSYSERKTISEDKKLHNEDVNFLINDLRRKIEHAFTGSSRKSFLKQSVTKIIGFSNLPPAEKCLDIMECIFPVFYRIFDKSRKYFEELHRSSDGVRDSAAYQSEECLIQQQLVHNILQIFNMFFAWEGFKSIIHQENLQTFLQYLSPKQSKSPRKQQTVHLNKLVRSVIDYFSQVTIPNIRVSVTQIKLMMTLTKWCNEDDVTIIIEKKAKEFLQSNWFDNNGDKEKGAIFHSYIYYLLSIHLDLSRDCLGLIENICDRGIQEIVNCNLSGEESTSDYLSLSRTSLPAYYRGFYEKVISYVKQEFPVNSKNKYQDLSWVNEKLANGEKLIKVFQTLNRLVKELENKQLFASSLKYSRLFFESFIKHVMPLLDYAFRTNKDTVGGILKCAQQSTRALQHLCGHTKFSKDVTSTNHVPALKKCLETFVFRVKAMLASNNCDQAFWMGNLKNRDLKGNEILSQMDSTNNSSQQEDGESDVNSIVEETAEELSEEHSESY